MAVDDTGSLFDAELRGTVARVLFENRESGWAVVHLEADQGGVVTAVGPLAPVFVGESLELHGAWETDRRYGRQFRARASMPAPPQGETGTRRYLASGAVPGIGPELAHRLVARFGTDTMRVLDEEPERLLTVSGIGPKRLQTIRAAWEARSAQREARVYLQGHGLGAALTERIIKAWGDDTLTRVRREPYALVEEVRGIGFRTADGLALRLGIEPGSAQRLSAGLRHELIAAADRGHCYLPLERLLHAAAKTLDLDDAAPLEQRVRALTARGELVIEIDEEAGDRVYHPWLHAAERRVARRLAALAAFGQPDDPHESDAVLRTLRQVETNLGLELADEQRVAVRRGLLRHLMVVTGGPGTGKTTLIDAVVRCAEMLDLEVALAAPTGRAAKRLEQATGRESKTLHRLLEYRYDSGFTRGPDNLLDADLVVVDEFSMVDLPLMDALVSALAPGCRLLMVGDADQLPPVGPGAVLRDLLESERVPTARLEEIFRQARASLIVQNAHRVNHGEMPLAAPRGREVDFYLIDETDPDRARDLVLRMVTSRIPGRFGLDPLRDVQVLAPMHRGRCGVARLNAELQAVLNPHAVPGEDPPRLQPGDRVMQLRNDYDREVFNGDIGMVSLVDPDEGVTVEFDGRPVGYDRGAMTDLTLAYATSVHKSQGSEYPAVVLLLLPEHHIMLQRNLLYTALTRARQVAVLISSPEALARAVRNAAPAARNTTLAQRLRIAFDGVDTGGQSAG